MPSSSSIASMTGYADLEREIGGVRYYFTARSVNHRTLDVTARFPAAFTQTIQPALEVAKSVLSRGRVTLAADRPPQTDGLSFSGDLVQCVRNARKKLKRSGIRLRDPSLGELLQINERLIEGTARKADGKAFLDGVRELVEQLHQSRLDEGKRLRKFLTEAYDEAKGIIDRIAGDADKIKAETVATVLRRLGHESKERIGAEISAEATVACAKADVTEEIERLKSHMVELGKLLGNGGGIGRKLDFILQEMRRESGTLTSKSAQPSLTHRAIELSLLVERLREQSQNIA